MCLHIYSHVVFMVNVTLTVPEELYKKMKVHKEFRWSEVARQAIEKKIREKELLQDLRDIAKAEKEHKEGKTISHKQLLRELELDAV